MSEEKAESKFGPDPELYARMSKAYESREDAEAALRRFMLGVKKLREECGVAEVMLLVANHYVGPGTKTSVSCQSMTMGSPDFRPELGALAFQTYTAPSLERADRLRRMAESPPAADEDE